MGYLVKRKERHFYDYRNERVISKEREELPSLPKSITKEMEKTITKFQIIYNFGWDGGIDEGTEHPSISSAFSLAMKKAKEYNLDKDNEGFIIIDKIHKRVVRQWGYVPRDSIFYPDSGYVWMC